MGTRPGTGSTGRDVGGYASLEPDRCPRVEPAVLDLVLVPGLAFDGTARRTRLGTRGEAPTTNCWRTAYRRARGWSPVHSRAGSSSRFRSDEHDMPMDVVVTEARHYPPGPLPRWAGH